jgi:competence protein ComFC
VFAQIAKTGPFGGEDFWKIDLVTYVPSTRAKEIRRGYNQAELFGREIAKRIGKPAASTLRRVKRTEDQNKLKLQKRKENVKDAFRALEEADLKNRKLLLVDDVYTTGSTSNECAKALRKAGAKQINVLTIARATLNY